MILHGSSLIQDYAASSTPFPLCHPPTYDDFYYAIVTSPDSAPGADGIPYAAWRVCPSISTLHWPITFKTCYTAKFHRLRRLLFLFPKLTRANTLTIIDRLGYQIPVIVLLTGRLIPYSVNHSLEIFIQLRRFLTSFVSPKAITSPFSTFWTPRTQPIVSSYLISLKPLNASTLTGSFTFWRLEVLLFGS